jgi:peptidoglycan/LPS O-acetylase OafA/YrhL
LENSIIYRPEVNGLRALAVIPVILSHAGFSWFSGGFIGVDVFFVISGYLITTIILNELENGNFSLKKFYERRARRIFPALFLVIISCIPFAWMWIDPIYFRDFAQSLVAMGFFASNILFWQESNYFGPAAEVKPLLHTWSLSIEEQFYVLFPILLIIVFKFARRYMNWVLLGALLFSLLLSEYTSKQDSLTSFFMIHTRAWELLTGGYIAYLGTRNVFAVNESASKVLTLFGVGLILYAIISFDQYTRSPGFMTVIPVLGAALVIIYGREKGLAYKILTLKPVVGIGLISYSLYLWHQPLFAFLRIYSLEKPGSYLYILMMILALILSIFSWKYVETPFRNKHKVSARVVVLFSGASAVIVITFGLMGHFQYGFSARFNDIERIMHAAKSNGNHLLVQNGKVCEDRIPKESCVLGPRNVIPKWALVGDSHAGSLGPSFQKALNTIGQAGVELTSRGCPYAPGFSRRYDNGACLKSVSEIRNYLLSSNVENIILAGRYVLLLERTKFDNGEGGREYGRPTGYYPSDDFGIAEPARRKAVIAGYKNGVRELLDHGKKVFLIYPIPEVGWNVPSQLFKRIYIHHLTSKVTTDYNVYRNRSASVITAFDNLGEHKNLTRVFPDKILCNTYEKARCATESQNAILYHDDDHLSVEGAALVINKIFTSQLKVSSKDDAL